MTVRRRIARIEGRRATTIAARGLVGAALCTSVLALSACGGDDDKKDTTTAASGSTGATTQAERPTGTPIKLMVTAAVDTQLQNAPGALAAVKAAANAINAKGGINGQPIDVLFCNNQSDPNKTAACAREAVSKKVTAVIPLATTTSTQLYPPLEAAKIPVVGALPSAPADWQSPMAYPVLVGAQIMNTAAPLQMKAHGINRLSTVSIDIAVAANQVDAIKAGSKVAGIEYSGTVLQPPTATDFSPFVQQLIKQKAEGAVLVGTDEATVSMLQAGNQLGTDITWAQTQQSVEDSTLLPPLGKLADGLLLPGGLPPVSEADDYPGMQQFLEEMKAAEDAGIEGADQIRYWSQGAWIATHAIAQVAEGVEGDLDAKALVAAMDKATDVDILGLVKWSPGTPGPKDFPRISNSTVYFAVAKDGKFVTDEKMPEPVDVFERVGVK